MGKLYLMMGLPGAGKSTLLKEHFKNNPDNVIVSRDEIRFSLVKENEDYFSHEDEVIKTFFEKIHTALKMGKDVYADQTSLTVASRKKFLNNIDKSLAEEINLIFIDTPYSECIINNDKRNGTRAFVPKGVIRRMHSQMEKPNTNEGFNYIFIYDIFNKTFGIVKGATINGI